MLRAAYRLLRSSSFMCGCRGVGFLLSSAEGMFLASGASSPGRLFCFGITCSTARDNRNQDCESPLQT